MNSKEHPIAGCYLPSNSIACLNKYGRQKKYQNFLHLLQNRELQNNNSRLFSKQTQIFNSSIQRLGIVRELEGHSGCVNCIEFNDEGNFLLSGSDDFCIILWDVYRRKPLKSFPTGHRGNIFSVKFLPETNDSFIVSGAGDSHIEVRELPSGEATRICTCHVERVKRIATTNAAPHLFFSASEDGTVMQFDNREKHVCSSHPNNVLVNLRCHAGQLSEAKCVAAHPLRPELIAVGANDPYVRVYDRRMIKLTSVSLPRGVQSRFNSSQHNSLSQLPTPNTTPNSPNGENSPSEAQPVIDDNLTKGCVQMHVPGHLPAKMERSNKYRTLAATYVCFSPDGSHLLANLGGDHIYLFDTINAQTPKQYVTPSKILPKNGKESNGVRKPSNGFRDSGDLSHDADSDDEFLQVSTTLPPHVEVLRIRAQESATMRDYTAAVRLYNSAIDHCNDVAALYAARAAALIKRKWKGDIYSALRDCYKALELDFNNLKAKFRQVRCLHLLGRHEETQRCLNDLILQHPHLSSSLAWASLKEKVSTATCCSDSDSDKDDIAYNVPCQLSEKEKAWRAQAGDYERVYCGHCNTTTDIKEAVFVGKDGSYIAAGSDDGNLFIWERSTANVCRVLEADKSIVNCVQSHPSQCLLATSGIETVVKMWAPLPQECEWGEAETAVADERLNVIASKNQQRLRPAPMEAMLLQISDFDGSFLNRGRRGGESDEDEGEADGNYFANSGNVQCRPT